MDGPLCEAILAAGPTYHPDLVITAVNQPRSLADLVQRVPYPLLLVPPEITYCPIERVGLAYDPTPPYRSESIAFIDQLAQTCGAEVEVLELGTAKQLASQATNQANVSLESFLRNVTHRFHYTLGEGTADEMKHYAEEYHPHVLVVLARQYLPYDVDPLERHTVAIAKNSPVPVLVLKS
jgi:nucleotide-binding universal stress UspA family protein